MAETSEPPPVCGLACAEPANADAISAQNDEIMAIKSIYDDCIEELGTRESSDSHCKHMEYVMRINFEPLVRPLKVTATATTERVDSCPPGQTLSAGCGGVLPSKPVLIRYLPPLLLKFRLPNGYPSSFPPLSSLSSPLLTPESQVALLEKLASLWEESRPDVCLFSWFDWLKNDAVSWLAADGCVSLPQSAVDALVAFDAETSAEAFASEMHTCDVCLSDKLGKDFVKLQCGQMYCSDCVFGYLSTAISSGEVLDLKCVDVDCGTVIPPHIIKEVVLRYARVDLWDAFERFTLLKGLEQLGDMVYCPRKSCGKPVLLDRFDGDSAPASTGVQWTSRGMIGMCSYCGYVFCRECRKVWHGGSKCETVIQKWLDGTPEVREELEKRFGSVLFQHALSEEWITKHTKPCPQCRTAIEKNLGCNHMTCKKCGYEWCWLCNATYTPGHYQRTSCEQFGEEYFRELGVTREMFYHQLM